MQVTVGMLAALVGGKVEGNPDIVITRPSGIESAPPDAVTFLADAKYESFLYSTQAGVVLLPENFELKHPVSTTLIRVPDVRAAIASLLVQFKPGEEVSGVASNAVVDPTAMLQDGVSVGHFSVIGRGVVIGTGTVIHDQVFVGKDVQIGRECIIYPGVKIYHGTRIGDRCIIHANVVIGADGFGFLPQPDHSWSKVPQVGIARIEDDVEIGANSTIDRATMGETVIERGAKLDNLIHIAHNVRIGAHTVIAAQVGIAGSTQVGEGCKIGGQAGIAGHITIADGTQVQAQSGIAGKIIEPNQAVFGSPAIPYGDFVRAFTVFKQLPDLAKKVSRLEKKLNEK